MNAGGSPARVKLASGRAPRIGLALGGGGARGLAHIHAIEALDELGVRPVAIAGSSIGAIMGAGMAAGLDGKAIREYAHATLSRGSEVMARLWKARPKDVTSFVTGLRLTQFDGEQVLRAFLPDRIPDRFEDLAIPLLVTATDYFGHGLAVLSSGPLYSALAASSALPAVFKPVERDGMTLIDGGIFNPVPFDLLEGRADIVVAIDVVGAPEKLDRRRPSSIDVMFGASQLMMQSVIAEKLKTQRPAVFLRPPVSRFRVLDFMKVDAVLNETRAFKDDVKHVVEAALAFGAVD